MVQHDDATYLPDRAGDFMAPLKKRTEQTVVQLWEEPP